MQSGVLTKSWLGKEAPASGSSSARPPSSHRSVIFYVRLGILSYVCSQMCSLVRLQTDLLLLQTREGVSQ
jgi:hypothetical protein